MFEKTKKLTISETLANGDIFNAELLVKRPSIKDRLKINQLRGQYAGPSPDSIALYQAEIVATIEVLVENLPEQLKQDSLDASDFRILEKIYSEIINWVSLNGEKK